MIPCRLDVERLYATLEMVRCHNGMSWRELGDVLGVAPSAFSRMARGGRPDADLLCAALVWLNMPVSRFVRPVLDDCAQRQTEEK